MKQDYDMKWNEDGSLHTVVTYPARDIEVVIANEKVIIGTQPEYDVLNLIDKEKLNKLKEYLDEQKKLLSDRIKAAEDVIKSTEGHSLEGLKDAIMKLPAEKIKSKKLQFLNSIAEKVVMREDASSKLVILKENLAKINEQLAFLT